jgi:YidC/Oxa1 family membrane protein insertase
MSMDKKSVSAVILSVLFYLAYSNYLKVKYPKPTVEATTAQQNTSGPETPISSAQPLSPATEGQISAAVPTDPGTVTYPQLSADQLTIENKSSVYTFSQANAGIASLVLKDFRQDKTAESKQVNLIDMNFAIQGLPGITGKEVTNGYFAERSGQSIIFRKQIGQWEISQQYTFPETGYNADLAVSWKNISATPAELTGAIAVFDTIKTGVEATSSFLPGSPNEKPMLLSRVSDATDRFEVEKHCKSTDQLAAFSVTNGNVIFFGSDNHYFQKVILPEGKTMNLSIGKTGPIAGDSLHCPILSVAAQPQGLVAAGQTVTLKFRTWFGPKSLDGMQAFEPELVETIDLGWFGFLAKPLFRVTQKTEELTGNWGTAIILVTLLLKALFFPLNRQASISMKKMNQLKPEMDKIREKFKDDKAAQQQAIMKFMSENNINPMKGCLPVLPQIPVFFAFYRILSTSIELRHAPFMGWIQDLSSADPYYVTPLLLGVAQFIQQKLTPTAGMDKAQERMMMMLPIVFTGMMLSLPSGMVLYMLANTIVSIGQQKWLNRRPA